MVVPFLFGGCFILFKDREVIHSAMIAAGARALLAFITSAHGESVSGFWHHRANSLRCGIGSLPEHSGHGRACCWLDPVANDSEPEVAPYGVCGVGAIPRWPLDRKVLGSGHRLTAPSETPGEAANSLPALSQPMRLGLINHGSSYAFIEFWWVK
jgi:hypothetical protein